jgi:very-short-patch-repair endonuclease
LLARRLRRDMTDAEQRLWRALRELELRNRFRRQHLIGASIVDFACPAAKLVMKSMAGSTRSMRQKTRRALKSLPVT